MSRCPLSRTNSAAAHAPFFSSFPNSPPTLFFPSSSSLLPTLIFSSFTLDLSYSCSSFSLIAASISPFLCSFFFFPPKATLSQMQHRNSHQGRECFGLRALWLGWDQETQNGSAEWTIRARKIYIFWTLEAARIPFYDYSNTINFKLLVSFCRKPSVRSFSKTWSIYVIQYEDYFSIGAVIIVFSLVFILQKSDTAKWVFSGKRRRW